MGEKDIAEKLLFDYNDVFADIVNVLLFNGSKIVHPDELQSTKDESQYKIDGKLHEQERDVSKIWKKGNIHISFVGFENQTIIDKDMPLRIIGYDGASYKKQTLSGNKDRYPVVTIVLYFGEEHWDHYRSLLDCVSVPNELKPFVNDYKINVFEVAYLTKEQVEMFHSDFKIVADFFVQKRINKDYRPSGEQIKHVDAILKLLSVLTSDFRYEAVIYDSKKGKVKNMCEVLDRIEANGVIKGEIKGKIEVLMEYGNTAEQIADRLGLSVEEVNEIIANISSDS